MSQSAAPTTGITAGLPQDAPMTPTIADLVDRSAGLVNRTWLLSADTDGRHHKVVEDHAELLADQLDARAHELAASGSAELLDQISATGLAWRDVAAIVGVSVPAVRKWRSGGSTTGDNRLRIAQLLALLDWLATEQHIVDVASWLEVPLEAGIPVNRLNLLVSGRRDLLLSSMIGPETTPAALLESFEPNWRDRYRSEFEVFTAEDGQRSIRSRNDRS